MELDLPKLILPNGRVNPEWPIAYQRQTGCIELEAHTQQQAYILALPEPALKTSKGNLSAVWVTWYKARKRVSTNIATNVGKAKIKSEGQENDQPEIKRHRTYYW